MGSCRLRAEESAKSQVAEFHHSLSCYKHIGRFDISVHDPTWVHMVQGTTYLYKILPYCLLWYKSCLSLKVLQREENKALNYKPGNENYTLFYLTSDLGYKEWEIL